MYLLLSVHLHVFEDFFTKNIFESTYFDLIYLSYSQKNMHIPDGNADLMSLRNGMTKYDLFFKVECFSMNIIVEVKKRKEA